MEKVHPNPTGYDEKDFCYHEGYALHIICADNRHEECPESSSLGSSLGFEGFIICYCDCHEPLEPIQDDQWEQVKDGLIEVYRTNVKT